MKLSNQQKTNFIFYGILAILFSVIILVVMLFVNVYPIFNLAIIGGGDMSCDCSHHVAFLNNHPYIGGFVISVMISMLVFVIFTLWQVLKNIIKTKNYIKNILRNKIKLSQKARDIAKSVGLEGKVIQVQNEATEVFCFGFINPRVCISSKLVRQVSRNQLRAILLHEKNHIKSHDPLKICIVNIIRRSLFFVPGIKEFINYFIVNLELSADERATNNFKEIKFLGGALLKISDLHTNYRKSNPSDLSVSFLSVTEERIDRLINKSFTVTLKISSIKFVTGIFVFIGLFIIVFNSQVWLVEASQMDEMSSDLVCNMEKTNNVVEDNKWDNSLCDHSSVNMSCLEKTSTIINTCF